MPDDTNPSDLPEHASADDLDARIARAVGAALNPAISSHLKRQQSAMDKAIADGVARALAASRPAEAAPSDAPAHGAPAKPDPMLVKLREELDTFKRRTEEAESRSRATEERDRTERTHGDLRTLLTKANVRPELLDAAHTVLATRALKFDEDGNATLEIKRARAKGASPEAVAFDLETGVRDWLASDEARPFLPAPGSAAPSARAGTPVRRVGALEPAQLAAMAPADRAAAYLAAAGIDPAGVVGRLTSE